MGKIRVKTLGIEEVEKEEKKKLKQKKEAKKMAKAPGLKGGERVISVGPSEEELEKITLEEEKREENPPASQANPPAKQSAAARARALRAGKEKFKKTAKRVRSKRYQTTAGLIDKNKAYPLSEALKLLTEKKTSFDETVELHVNTSLNGISVTATLPHGTGKNIRVAVADDALIGEVEKGKINFDILVSSPSMMPKLAKVAKILGPRGLMPNPKNGTISDKPEDVIKKFQAGHITVKTEAKAPIIHLAVGKVSFGEKKLTDNITTLIDAIKKENIKKIVLKSTMSPGIKLQL